MNKIQLIEDGCLELVEVNAGAFLSARSCQPPAPKRRKRHGRRCCNSGCCGNGSDNDRQRVKLRINGDNNIVFIINDNDGLIAMRKLRKLLRKYK